MVEGWMYIVRPIVSLANLWLVSPLTRALGAANRVEAWLQGTPETGFDWDEANQRAK